MKLSDIKEFSQGAALVIGGLLLVLLFACLAIFLAVGIPAGIVGGIVWAVIFVLQQTGVM